MDVWMQDMVRSNKKNKISRILCSNFLNFCTNRKIEKTRGKNIDARINTSKRSTTICQ